jgi:hypothetical protein
MALEPGHSAMWFNPERSGEGLVVEVLASDRVLLYWFTYDDEGHQRWLQGVGILTSGEDGPASIDFSEFYSTRGPIFGPAFNPDDLEIIPVGTASLVFQGCESGTFHFDVNGETGQIPLVRLSRTMGSTCRPLHGVPGEPTKAYAGESGSWFDPQSSGQGLSLQWMTRDEALVTWYTYDAQGNQYWLVGNGQREGDDIVFETLNATRGARFGAAFDPDDVELIDWGSLRLSLSCGAGTAQYNSDLEAFGSGTLELTRLTSIDSLPCPWTPPEITDLYDIYIEIVVDSSQLFNRNIEVFDVSADGTILGWDFQDSSAWLRRAGEDSFERLPNDDRILTPLLTDDGTTVYAIRLVRDTGQSFLVRWTEETGWEDIEGALAESPGLIAASHSRETLIGVNVQASSDDDRLWTWNENVGFEFIRPTVDGNLLIPLAVSNDGRRFAAVQRPETPFDPVTTVFWIDAEESREILFADPPDQIAAGFLTCGSDCRTVFGVPTDPSIAEGDLWFSIDGSPAQFQIQDLVPAAQFIQPSITAVSGNGTIVAGGFFQEPLPTQNAEAFIWSQDLGFVKISDLLTRAGFKWGVSNIIRVKAISQNGLVLLVDVISTLASPSPSFSRGVLIDLSVSQGASENEAWYETTQDG